jgi:hypothetical protein
LVVIVAAAAAAAAGALLDVFIFGYILLQVSEEWGRGVMCVRGACLWIKL